MRFSVSEKAVRSLDDEEILFQLIFSLILALLIGLKKDVNDSSSFG